MATQRAIKTGAVVYHVTKGFTGRVIGTTRIRQLFENAKSTEEYRVQVAPDDIRIAAADSLAVIPPEVDEPEPFSGTYTNHCWACKGPINERLARCEGCAWFTCPMCGACDPGCGSR